MLAAVGGGVGDTHTTKTKDHLRASNVHGTLKTIWDIACTRTSTTHEPVGRSKFRSDTRHRRTTTLFPLGNRQFSRRSRPHFPSWHSLVRRGICAHYCCPARALWLSLSRFRSREQKVIIIIIIDHSYHPIYFYYSVKGRT